MRSPIIIWNSVVLQFSCLISSFVVWTLPLGRVCEYISLCTVSSVIPSVSTWRGHYRFPLSLQSLRPHSQNCGIGLELITLTLTLASPSGYEALRPKFWPRTWGFGLGLSLEHLVSALASIDITALLTVPFPPFPVSLPFHLYALPYLFSSILSGKDVVQSIAFRVVSIYWQGVALFPWYLNAKWLTHIGSTCVAHTSPDSAAPVMSLHH